MEDVSVALADVRGRMAGQPLLLRIFDRLVRALTERSDVQVGLAVSGSLVAGGIDQWSDLDLEVILPRGADVGAMLSWTSSIAQSVSQPLCFFPASHVGLDQILVFFFLEDGQVVKADLYVVELDEYLGLTGNRLVVDPGFVSEAREHAAPSPPPPPDFEDLHMKFCGWIWYTYTKIERGELMEAFDSLQVMRNRALLPSLQCVLQLPYEGNRRLEARLSPEMLAAVHATLARSTEPDELHRSLLALAHLFQSLQPQVARALGRDHQRAKLDTMIQHVEGRRRAR
jgi:hypothetical protein